VLDAAAGRTRYESEGAFALSLARHNAIRPGAIWELKAQTLKKNNLLTLHRGEENFASLGGLNNLKDFCRRALQPAKSVTARGVLLLGVPGTGKSAFAKALGNETSYLMRISPEIYQQEQERVARRFEEAVQLAEQAFIAEFAKLVSHLSERLSNADGGERRIFRDSAITNLSEFFQRFQSLNVRSNQDLDQLVDQAQQLVRGLTPQDLRDDNQLRQQISTEMNQMQTTLEGMLVERPRDAIQPNACRSHRPRCVGPPRADDLRLRAQVDWTGAGCMRAELARPVAST